MHRGIAFLALAWGISETAYFGWNWQPQSHAELACDGFAVLLMALAFVVGNR